MKGIVAITAALATSALAVDPQANPAPAASSPSASSGSSSIPLPDAFTSPEWIAAYAKAKTYLKKFTTLNQKVALATGVGWTNGPCVGNTPAIPEVGFPGQCLEDSPLGVRFADKVSAFPAAVNVATTFNRDLFRKRGAAMGAEHRAKGVNIQLGPMMNLARVAAGGRNWEGFGADPFLSGEAAYETIIGIQSQGVQACAKHYINNEQEHFRDTSTSDVDDRTQHEVYAHPFLRSIQANVASVMCSYNRINGTYACENDKTLNGILKQEYGFKGYVMSDWQATHSTMSVVTGLDMTMPGDVTFNSGTTYFGDVLVDYVKNGTIPESRIDDMATRILAGWFLVGQDKNFPATNFDAWTPSKGQHVDAQGDHAKLIRQIGAEGTVLLKNTGSLPLNKPKSIAIVGNDAGPGSKGPNGYSDRGGNDGILAMGWGSGTAEFPYLIDPLSAITKRSSKDSTTIASSLSDSDLAAAATAAADKDVAIVFLSADSGEGYITVEGNFGDRNNLKAWHNGDALVAAVAAANKNTVVVVNAVGPIIVEPWIDHPNVTALVWAGLQGQEAGNAIADVLYGDVPPAGRLPYTIAKKQEDYNAQVIFQNQKPFLSIPYSEGLNIDYRHFDSANIAPRYEFGFGLSYTTFQYSGLHIIGGLVGNLPLPSGPGSALNPILHDKHFVTVSFTIRNTGKRAGTEVPQVYISLPASANSPPSLLKGFDSIKLAPGASKQVTVGLSRYDFSIWDVVQQKWVVPKGKAGVFVGASSRDKKLVGSVNL